MGRDESIPIRFLTKVIAVDRHCRLRLWLCLPRDWRILLTVLFVPPVERREVTRVPRVAESGFAQIPVRANFARHGAQVVPKIDDRRAPPEPIAVIDAVD